MDSPPVTTRGPLRAVTIEKVSAELLSEHALRGSWQAVADRRRISKGMAYRVAHGYEPKDPTIRRRLGLGVPVEERTCLARRKCDGKRFTPNVPWRYSCYDCSPMRSPDGTLY